MAIFFDILFDLTFNSNSFLEFLSTKDILVNFSFDLSIYFLLYCVQHTHHIHLRQVILIYI